MGLENTFLFLFYLLIFFLQKNYSPYKLIMLKETFFSLLLSKMFNTAALTSSLAVCCESKDKPLLLLGFMLGLLVQVILCNTLTATTMEHSATIIQISLSIMVMALATIAGYHSTKNFKKHQQIVASSRILNLVLLPACFISSQSTDIVLYLAHQVRKK